MNSSRSFPNFRSDFRPDYKSRKMEDEDNVPRTKLAPTATLLGLPEEILLNLLEKYICHPQDNLNLRKVCHHLKNEIDFQIGIRNQITFSSSLEDPQRFSFLCNIALRSVHINGSLSPSKILYKFDKMLLEPLKLQSLRITGGFWYKYLSSSILQKCPGLCKLELHCCFLLEESTALSFSNLITSKITLPSLTTLSVITEPYPPRQNVFGIETDTDSNLMYRKHCKTPFYVLESLNAPHLKNFQLRTKYVSTVNLDLLNLMDYSIMSFICRHSHLSSVRVSIEKSDRGCRGWFNGHEEVDWPVVMDRPLQLVTRIRDDENGSENNEEEQRLQGEMSRLMSGCHNLQNLQDFKFQLDSEEGHEKLLEWIRNNAVNLKDFAIKIKSNLIDFDNQLHRLIRANVALTKIFIYCGFKIPKPRMNQVFRDCINFCVFCECPNLEVISFHENLGRITKTLLRNVGVGLSNLTKLKVLILNGFILDGRDLEEMSASLRDNASSHPSSWDNLRMGSLEVLGITKASLGLGMEAVLQDIGEGPAVTGITFQCFVNFLTNRRLNAILFDMDSINIANLREGAAVEKTREAITGLYRSLLLDVSNKDCAVGEVFPYWKLQLSRFTVNFDPFHE